MKKNKRVAIYPGTFDPVTNGHLDILTRATELFDEVIMAVVEKPAKKTLFTSDERVALLRNSIKGRKFKCPVTIQCFKGLLVNFARRKKAHTVVRGLRAVSDFEYEFQMALMNRNLAPQVETIFLMPDEKYVYLSSSVIKVVGELHGNLSPFLPAPVIKAFEKRFSS